MVRVMASIVDHSSITYTQDTEYEMFMPRTLTTQQSSRQAIQGIWARKQIDLTKQRR